MSLLIKTLKPGQLLHIHKTLSVIQARNGSHWYPDYKPGPVPKTKEERLKAAKKYNLLPEEYETYPEGSGHGDYPKLPFESVDARDPWYPWENQELRKGFNEPVNVRIMNLLPEMYSTVKPETPDWKGVMYFCLLVGGSCIILYGANQIKYMHKALNKQLPFTGETHYTFELDHMLNVLVLIAFLTIYEFLLIKV